MKHLKPDKLKIEYRDGVTQTEPVIGRKYTLTHSDRTEELFLTIGKEFAYDKINVLRDEVLAEWRLNNEHPYLHVYVYLNGRLDSDLSKRRDIIFRRELPLALEAIRYGDREFFKEHPGLDYAHIWIHFDSANPDYNRLDYYGQPHYYK